MLITEALVFEYDEYVLRDDTVAAVPAEIVLGCIILRAVLDDVCCCCSVVLMLGIEGRQG